MTDYSIPNRIEQPIESAGPIPSLSSDEFIEAIPLGVTLPSNAPLSQ